jgi:hypothetical protein
MKLNKKLMAIALGVAVVGTAVVGVAFADTSTTPAQPAQNLSQAVLSNLASTLNISQATLTGDIQTAETQAVNQAVSSGQLTQTQATPILSRIGKGNFQFLGFGGNRKGGMGNRKRGGAFMTMKPLATALGLTPKVLMSDLRSGQTISALATAQGTSVQALQSTILTSVQTQLAQAVTNGKMTQTQENQILQNISSGNWITQLQNMGQHQHPATAKPAQ